MPVMKVNVKKIKRLMRKEGLSVYELAVKSGMRERNMYRIFSDRTTRFTTLSRIAKAFGLDAKDLLE